MSAESPRGSADLTVSSPSDNSTASAGQTGAQPPANGSPTRADFGPNQWLVDELYQRYLADPGSVDRAWWSFFADYQPIPDSGSAQSRPAASPGVAQPDARQPAAGGETAGRTGQSNAAEIGRAHV